MTRGLLAVALACGLLAGCAMPEDKFFAVPETPGGFVFVAESYDLYPTRRYEGEARRLQDLEQFLASNNLCPYGYLIDRRQEAAEERGLLEDAIAGGIFRVTYQGRCAEALSAGGAARPAGAPAPGAVY